MKKLYFTILSAMLGLAINAQTLTVTNHSLSVGSIFKTRQCDSTGVNPGAGTGAGQNWNFSTVNTRSTVASTNYTVVTAASTGSNYPGANISFQPATNNNNFYSYTTTDFNYYGGNLQIGSFAVVFTYTTPAVLVRYPMSLNTNSVTSAVGGSIVISGNNGTYTGTNTTMADATGTLTLPATGTIAARTFSNVLRVVNTQTLNFFVIVSGTVIRTTYDYYDISVSRSPLFTIKTSYINSIAGTATETLVTVNADYQAVGIAEVANEVSNYNVYPNPSKSNVTVSFTNDNAENASLEIINAVGQTVRKENIGNEKGNIKHNVNIEGLNSGIYFMKIYVGQSTSLKKITVQ